MALPLATHPPELPACFWHRKAEALCHAISKRAQRTHPSMAVVTATLLLQKEREADRRHRSPVRAQIQTKKQTVFCLFGFLGFFYCFYVSSSFSSVSVSQVLSMSKYGHTHRHACTRTHTHPHCLSLSPLFISSMLHCIICGSTMAVDIATLIIYYKVTHNDVTITSGKLTCV